MKNSDPSPLDITEYFFSLAEIESKKAIKALSEIEPSFDLVDAYFKLERAPVDPTNHYREIVDPGWKALVNTDFEYSDFWAGLVGEALKANNQDTVKFLNFYIMLTFDRLVEALHENWDFHGVEDQWRLYDLMCDYPHLDKSMQKHIKKHGADEVFRRP